MAPEASQFLAGVPWFVVQFPASLCIQYFESSCFCCAIKLIRAQLQAAPASLGMRGDEVRRVRASGIAGAGTKGTSMASTAPASLGTGVLGVVQGVGSGSAAAAAALEVASAARKSALPPGRRGPAMTKGAGDAVR